MTLSEELPEELPEELLALALEAARQAAALVRDRRTREVRVADTKSSEVDVVTEADRASEALIRSLVLARRPDDSFLGEEGDDVVGSSDVRWVVDPIDGTVNFLYGLPQFSVSVAAEVRGRTVAGVVINVSTGVEYTGVDRAGTITSRRDGEPIGVNAPTPLALTLVGTGFSYDSDLRALQGAAVARLLPRVRDLRRLGSCALDLCHVAEGLLDAYVEEGVNPWDHAAGVLIAQGAGARAELLTGIGGRALLVCAPSPSYAGFEAAVRSAGFASGFTG